MKMQIRDQSNSELTTTLKKCASVEYEESFKCEKVADDEAHKEVEVDSKG